MTWRNRIGRGLWHCHDSDLADGPFWFRLRSAYNPTVWRVEHCTALFVCLWRTAQGYALPSCAFSSIFFDVNSIANDNSFITDGWLKSTFWRDDWYLFSRWIDMNSFSPYQIGVMWVLVGFMDIGLKETQLVTFSLIFSLLRVFLRGELSIQSSPWHRSVPFRTFRSYFIIFRTPWRNWFNLFPLHIIQSSTWRFFISCDIYSSLRNVWALGRILGDLDETCDYVLRAVACYHWSICCWVWENFCR
jgi:hypothetical protein